MEHRQDASVVLIHDILLERREDVSRGLNNGVPPVRLHDVSKNLRWNTQQRLNGASRRRLSGT